MIGHARTRHQGPWEVTYTGSGPRARAQPLGFSDAAGTDPSTDVVLVLNHEAVVGGFARAYDVHGIEVPDMHIIILKYSWEEINLVQINARTIHAAGMDPTRPGDDAAQGAPPTR